MVIDTSAVLAWLKNEAGRERIVTALEAHPVRRMWMAASPAIHDIQL